MPPWVRPSLPCLWASELWPSSAATLARSTPSPARPCVLGFNLWSGFQPLGSGTSIMDLEDFLVSDNILPLGSLVYLLFCVTRKGWGWDNFLAEANTGSGLRFPRNVRFYVTFLLPIIMFIIFVMGYWNRFFA